ncbi:MAG: hypothetical protein A3D96_00145 [Chlamydiae bacterium RIFCSPHIGHO2_12_FULL_44_59]|nr:MAG: hypothetical protein A2796_07290 [Chlamydiae bacterium RIFCSPHIGHO2_01_FULL_44_39]OGN60796.1 MAG: hypothetical protein A3D96_00145 [Chlamydiae bacterium RIFCSPHIGHO2_12_FULL_44_59]OGN66672.1 MAG: hypothetical protein A2978_02780 [Chlamydiae bacterium RIFCSPLOWO2_01_FULL_44_52]OGN67322.1 MAG: hypothetical protein A3I67_05975 [Chlamydiae bacterium RIFCSPLOWO2_02_FULL_45_22]OGN70597.1 MAG: hypothetical protein A3F79_06890 [Chlamydiae bacterium RIFCSPLOWO2_12_FULL_45_20]
MTDVLVVGAGPTGLFMAICLLRQGLTVRIIDRALAPSDKSRAIAIQARTLEIFDQVGIVNHFLEKGLKLKAANAVANRKRIARVPFDHLDSPFPFILSLPQYDTEQILIEYLKFLGCKIERGVELLSFVEKDKEIEATLSVGTARASWLIGCDGAHSTTRKCLAFAFEGRTFTQEFALADVEIAWDFPHDEFTLFLSRDGILAAIPLPEKGRYRVIFQQEPVLEVVENLLKRHAQPNVQVRNPRWITSFSINSRMTEQTIKGRVILAGDAAHIHSPAGGQGMNTGFSDAYNLSWKLKYVHEGKAKHELLATYDLERRNFGKKLLQATERASKIAMLDNLILVALRNFVFRHLTKHAYIQKKLASLISQIGLQYDTNVAIGAGGGKRAPNANTEKGDLFQCMRTNPGFILMNNRDKILIPEAIPLTHDGWIYDSHYIYVIRPDSMIGCKSSNPKVIQEYFFGVFDIQKEKR